MVAVLLGAHRVWASSLMLQVEPRTEECFTHVFGEADTVYFDFMVTRGGMLDVNVRASSPSGVELHNQLHYFPDGSPEEKKQFVAREAGPYVFCFDNKMSRWTAKVVRFSISHVAKAPATQPVPSSEVDVIRNVLDEANINIRRIHTEQEYLRAREESHIALQTGVISRMWWFTMLESIVLLGVAAWQVYNILRWFEVRNRGLIV